MDYIFFGLLAMVVCTGAAAIAASLYAISVRANIAELDAAIVALKLERADREAAIPGAYSALEAECERLRARWRRLGEPFTLALVDLGNALHPQADLPPTVMGKVMTAIDEARRTEDCWFQLDGRTAAVLLAGSSTEGGWAFVDRLRRLLGNEPFAHEAGAAYVDVRVGVAEWSQSFNDLAQLIDSAYRARKDFSGEIQEQRDDFLPRARGAA